MPIQGIRKAKAQTYKRHSLYIRLLQAPALLEELQLSCEQEFQIYPYGDKVINRLVLTLLGFRQFCHAYTPVCTFQANSKAQPMLSLLSVSMMDSLLSIDQCPEQLSSDPIRYILHSPNLTNHWIRRSRRVCER